MWPCAFGRVTALAASGAFLIGCTAVGSEPTQSETAGLPLTVESSGSNRPTVVPTSAARSGDVTDSQLDTARLALPAGWDPAEVTWLDTRPLTEPVEGRDYDLIRTFAPKTTDRYRMLLNEDVLEADGSYAELELSWPDPNNALASPKHKRTFLVHGDRRVEIHAETPAMTGPYSTDRAWALSDVQGDKYAVIDASTTSYDYQDWRVLVYDAAADTMTPVASWRDVCALDSIPAVYGPEVFPLITVDHVYWSAPVPDTPGGSCTDPTQLHRELFGAPLDDLSNVERITKGGIIFAVDDTTVYWGDDRYSRKTPEDLSYQIRSYTPDGGTQVLLRGTLLDGEYISGVAADDTGLVWVVGRQDPRDTMDPVEYDTSAVFARTTDGNLYAITIHGAGTGQYTTMANRRIGLGGKEHNRVLVIDLPTGRTLDFGDQEGAAWFWAAGDLAMIPDLAARSPEGPAYLPLPIHLIKFR